MSESVGGGEVKVLGRELSSNKNERSVVGEIMRLFNNKSHPRHLCPRTQPSCPPPFPIPEVPSSQRPMSVPDPLDRPDSRRPSPKC